MRDMCEPKYVNNIIYFNLSSLYWIQVMQEV